MEFLLYLLIMSFIDFFKVKKNEKYFPSSPPPIQIPAWI